MAYIVISVLILLVCVLLMLFVLVQNSKGGGLVSSMASTGQVMGVRKSMDVLEKGTWSLAVALLLLCVVAVAAIPDHTQPERAGSLIQEQLQRTAPGVQPVDLPEVPTQEFDQPTPDAAQPAEPAPEETPAE